MNDNDSAWADELIQRARASANPASSAEKRVFAAVERRLGLAALGSVEAFVDDAAPAPTIGIGASDPARVGVPSRSAGRAVSLARSQLLASIGAFGLATGALGYWWGSHDARARVDAPAPPLEVAVAAPSVALPAPPEAPAPVPEQPAPSAALPSAASASPARAAVGHGGDEPRPPVQGAARAALQERRRDAPLGLGEAIALLQRAQTALRQGEPQQALALLGTLDGRAPAQLVKQEISVTRTLALCDLGDVEGARAALNELELEEADSIYLGRLETSCVGIAIDDAR